MSGDDTLHKSKQSQVEKEEEEKENQNRNIWSRENCRYYMEWQDTEGRERKRERSGTGGMGKMSMPCRTSFIYLFIRKDLTCFSICPSHCFACDRTDWGNFLLFPNSSIYLYNWESPYSWSIFAGSEFHRSRRYIRFWTWTQSKVEGV